MRTVGDLIRELLCKGGVQEAVAVRVKLQSGAVVDVYSDDHPVMNQDAKDVESLTPKQSASGG